MRFPFDTFVVVDLPPHVVQQVRGIRKAYGSARQFLPVEITVAGSSGVGIFDATQDADEALRTLERLAGEIAPFPMELTGVTRFPGTGVFYYDIKDTAPLFAIHERIKASGLQFQPSPFPFSPHLTIDTFDEASDDLVKELLALPVPQSPFQVEGMSVYSLNGWDCRVVKSYRLGTTRQIRPA